MSVASFVAAQRTDHGVPHAVSCRALGVSESWFYKWKNRPLTVRRQRRARLDAEVRRSYVESDGDYGSPRVRADLREWGWTVSTKTVAASMARQGLVGRPTRRRFRCLTRPDKTARPVPLVEVARDLGIGAGRGADRRRQALLGSCRGSGVTADPRVRPV